MKKYFFSLLGIAMMAMTAFVVTGCDWFGNDDDDNDDEVEKAIIRKLAGTWERVDTGYDDVTSATYRAKNYLELTFSEYGSVAYKYVGFMYSSKNTYTTDTSSDTYKIESSGNKIKIRNTLYDMTLTNTELYLDGVKFIKTSSVYDDDDSSNSYNSGSSSGGSGSGSGSGSSSRTGEAPNIIDYSFTYTSTSVTIIFHTDVDITGATVYIGKSSATATSAVSASWVSVGRRQVTATIKNLSKSTKYYVKCRVKNSYGSTTSDTFPVMTGN